MLISKQQISRCERQPIWWKCIGLPCLVFAFLLSTSVFAAEVEGVNVPDTAMVAGQSLQLNGAGVRTKFFFDIYVGALYLSHPAHQAKQAIEDAGPKRVSMYFLYGEVGREKLTDGWVAGFEKNQTKEAMDRLKPLLKQFNAMFGDARKGDVYIFDFLPDGTTTVTFKGQKKGHVQGEDFQQALLAVWLGKHPADKDLKKAMLRGGD
ncbi:MAG: chalcone isomerase family protein [Mariprofundaceae bacterium]|nr:chalcone isomerase family protein [Mariprofundaceae bacterium]